MTEDIARHAVFPPGGKIDVEQVKIEYGPLGNWFTFFLPRHI